MITFKLLNTTNRFKGYILIVFSFSSHPFSMSYSPSIQYINWNSSALTVTSFIFNDGPAYSPWIDTSLGHKSVFKKHSDLNVTASLSRFRPFVLSDWALTPACSVELLAFIHLNPPHYNKPSIGNSTLTFGDEHITCFYRTMYGRWFGDKGADKNNYWPTMIYCPVPPAKQSSCNKIRYHRESFTYGMYTGSKWWKNTFKPHRKSSLPADVAATVSSTYIHTEAK